MHEHTWFRIGSIAVLATAALAQDAKDVVQRARALAHGGDRVAALALLDAAIQPQTTNVALWMVRGEVRFEHGALEDALADCNRGIELLTPKGGLTVLVGEGEGRRDAIAASVRLRANVRGKLGDWRGAADDLANATTLQPKRGAFWRERGYVEQNLGRLDASLASLDKAIALHDGDEAMYRLFRSDVLILMNRGADARTELTLAAELVEAAPSPSPGAQQRSPGLAEVAMARAFLAAALGDAAETGTACDHASAAAPAFAGWFALLRWSSAKPADRDSATQRLRADFAAEPAADPLVAELLRLCTDGIGEADGMQLADRDTTARCPLWFFGGCRAALMGRTAEARDRFARCVNTGRLDYGQWRIALARLRASTDKQVLRPSLGATVTAVANAKSPTLLVAAVTPTGAASIQGMQRGDRLLRVNDRPATTAEFEAMTKRIAIGTPVRFVVERAGVTSELVVTTGVVLP